MKYNSDIHHRKSIRLKGYDYSQSGAYFIIICTNNRQCLFGKILDNEMKLNKFGKIVHNEWIKSRTIREEIELYDNEFTVMPNHIHGIVWIKHSSGRMGDVIIRPDENPCRGKWPFTPTKNNDIIQPSPFDRPKIRMIPKSLSSFVAGFKSSVTKQINQLRNTPHLPIWQPNYYEHIIRNENELNKIREYIINNPLQWELDNENPKRKNKTNDRI